jgi:hypothetical protein
MGLADVNTISQLSSFLLTNTSRKGIWFVLDSVVTHPTYDNRQFRSAWSEKCCSFTETLIAYLHEFRARANAKVAR